MHGVTTGQDDGMMLMIKPLRSVFLIAVPLPTHSTGSPTHLA